MLSTQHYCKEDTTYQIGKWLLRLGSFGAIIMILFTQILIIGTVPSSSMANTIKKGEQIIGLRHYSKINRGDIVMFRSNEYHCRMVKRVIGLPGDHIKLKNNKVFINNKEYNEPYLKEKMSGMEDECSYTVPANSYFLLGDNRNDSFDARYWTKHYISKKDITGKAVFKASTIWITAIPYYIRRVQ